MVTLLEKQFADIQKVAREEWVNKAKGSAAVAEKPKAATLRQPEFRAAYDKTQAANADIRVAASASAAANITPPESATLQLLHSKWGGDSVALEDFHRSLVEGYAEARQPPLAAPTKDV